MTKVVIRRTVRGLMKDHGHKLSILFKTKLVRKFRKYSKDFVELTESGEKHAGMRKQRCRLEEKVRGRR